VKDSVPGELRSRVIYKFTYACLNACYIGETGRHFSTRVREHLSPDKSSLKKLRKLPSIVPKSLIPPLLNLKEAMNVNWEMPNLNQQVHHVN